MDVHTKDFRQSRLIAIVAIVGLISVPWAIAYANTERYRLENQIQTEAMKAGYEQQIPQNRTTPIWVKSSQ